MDELREQLVQIIWRRRGYYYNIEYSRDCADTFLVLPAVKKLREDAEKWRNRENNCPRCNRPYRFKEEIDNKLCAVCIDELIPKDFFEKATGYDLIVKGLEVEVSCERKSPVNPSAQFQAWSTKGFTTRPARAQEVSEVLEWVLTDRDKITERVDMDDRGWYFLLSSKEGEPEKRLRMRREK